MMRHMLHQDESRWVEIKSRPDSEWLLYEDRGVAFVEIHRRAFNTQNNIERFGDEVCSFVAASDAERVVVSFDQVRSCSSSVLTQLILIQKCVTGKGGELLIIGMNETLRDIVVATGLHRQLHLCHSIHEALARPA